MKSRQLGKTGLQVSELAAGGLFLSSYGGEFEQSRKALLRAVELGGELYRHCAELLQQ